MTSRPGWCSLKLAEVCITKDVQGLADISQAIALEFDNKDIRKIWQLAKSCLQTDEVQWLKQQLKFNAECISGI